MDVLEQITDTVHSCFTKDFQVMTREEKHNLLVRRIHELAVQLGFTAIRRFPIRNVFENRVGRTDIVWLKGLTPVAAFEMGSSLRKRSMLKLLAASVEHRIWIYYGHRDPREFLSGTDPHNQIHVISPKLFLRPGITEQDNIRNIKSGVYSPYIVKPLDNALFGTTEHIRQAVLSCARSLPDTERKIERIREEIIKLVDMALLDLQEPDTLSQTDSASPPKKAYHERLDEVRRKHPRAYEKWMPGEEQELIQKYQGGATIPELSLFFERQPSAISSRLRKLGLLTD